MVNYEATSGADGQCAEQNQCSVTVTATDSSGTDTAGTGVITIEVTDVNEAPEFPETVTRYVAENMADDKTLGKRVRLNIDGDTVGDPATDDRVEATDPEAATLAYSLGGPHAMYFAIYKASGQIITKELLDYEALPGNDKTYTVTVTATDPRGLTATTDVTIEVVDANEPPVIVDGLSISGPSGVNYAENGTDAVDTYEVEGLNAATAMWSLEGADASQFMLAGTGLSRMLKFRSAPNFEDATDADTDNVYEVTVKATDPNEATIMDIREVKVTVTDADDVGMVTGLPTSAMVG